MASLGNLAPELPELPRRSAQVIDILTGASAAPSQLATEAPVLSPTPILEFEKAAWRVVRHSQDFRERASEWSKRAVDFVGSLALLVALSPFILLVIIAIKISSPGPILFEQVRIGRRGRPFRCLKFRTMVPGAEELLKNNAALRAAFERNYKIKDDPRVSRLGALLRSSSFDEIPQLWNVVRGDMSLIGPRPVVPPELAKYGAHAKKLLSVMPGVSGLWQTCGRSDTTYEQRVRFDMLYVDHRSLWLDIKLILLTVVAVCRKVGAC